MKKWLVLILLCLIASSVLANRYITTGEIKVMAEKDPNSKVLGRLQNHTIVEVTGVGNSWWKINYDGKEAYVQGRYLKQARNAEGMVDLNDPDTIFIIIGSALLIFTVLFVVLKGAHHQLAPRYPRPGSSQLSKAKSLFSYWYQCAHCNVSIRNSAEPRTAGCAQAKVHSWINLGEAGDVKYLCKTCSTFVAMRSEPAMEGCLNGGMHEWRKF